MRYFVGMGEVAGVLSGISTGFSQLGIKADLYLFGPHPHAYQFQPNIFTKCFFFLYRVRMKWGVLGISVVPLRFSLTLILFIYSLFKYDIFIFTGFGSFFRFYELPFLKLFNKKIVVIYLGSDARPPYLSGVYLDENNGVIPVSEVKTKIRKMLRRIFLVESFADVIVNHTATAQFMKRKFIPLLYLGLPIDIVNITKIADSSKAIVPKSKKVIKIIHAPSRTRAKGSTQIKNTINELNDELNVYGLQLELVELTNRSNVDVIAEIASCDFVVNELYADNFLSILDAEAAVLGKPSLKFGYYAEHIIYDNKTAVMPENLIYFEPQKLKDIIRLYAMDETLRLRSGENIKKFVIEEWSGKRVAERLESFLVEVNTSKDSDKLVDPGKLNYLFGWGLPKYLLYENLNIYINEVGEKGLHLPDRLMSLLRDELDCAKLSND